MLIRFSINVDEISQDRLIPGKKGRYLNAVCFIKDAPDQYGNHGMITESVTIEEKDAGKKGKILGNVKVLNAKVKTEASSDGLPF